ncbi:hypothetical protein G8E10_09480 [Rhizobiaceae bacterium CRRU44]|uniref:Uncharacterized protein n=1 Tax=Ferranicluibacter rubi TaxID=2715133 RepID=A0AA43ZDR1_9HYPH|nr:hypothetical protein [Ferranicluibacter rubi]NHT75910.1 hypothetical protein [Ferranicluibacter rubi]NHT75970.1 hypothetical protein [Ferranicluibacter rubi]
MKCNFVVGQRVVCINSDWPENGVIEIARKVVPTPSRVPMINEVLTIREIRGGLINNEVVFLHFEEFPHGWDSRHFAPLITRKTDISIFTDMLTPAGKEKADA